MIMRLTPEKLFCRLIEEATFFGGSFFFAFLAAFLFFTGKDLLSLRLIALYVLSLGLAVLIRLFYFRERPDKEKYTNLFEKLDSSSFPSLHSMRVAGLFVLFNSFYGSFFISVIFLGVALLVFASRYFLKKHYVSDILAGAVLGMVLAYLIGYLSMAEFFITFL